MFGRRCFQRNGFDDAAQQCQGSRSGRQQGRARGRAGKGRCGEIGSGLGVINEETADRGFHHQSTEGMTVDVDMWDLGHHQWEATRVRRSTRRDPPARGYGTQMFHVISG